MSNEKINNEMWDQFTKQEEALGDAAAIFQTIKLAHEDGEKDLFWPLVSMLDERLNDAHKSFDALHAGWVKSKAA